MSKHVKPDVNILLLDDLSQWDNYDKFTAKRGYRYSDLIRRERKFLRNLIDRKYNRTKLHPGLVVIVYIHANFGMRQDKDYKVVLRNGPDYLRFMQTDDYSEVGDFLELKVKL